MTGSFEPFLRRDNSPAYTEEWKRKNIKVYSLQDLRNRDVKNGVRWIGYLTVFAVVATLLYFAFPAHAETAAQPVHAVSIPKDLYDQPDSVQEKAYCQMWAKNVSYGNHAYVSGASGNTIGQFCLNYLNQ